ncbi:hypothetical protein MJ547_04250, partial [Burkholderia gladioli]
MLFKLYDRWASQGIERLDRNTAIVQMVLAIPAIIGFLATFVVTVAMLYSGSGIVPFLITSAKGFGAVFAYIIVAGGGHVLTLYLWQKQSDVARSIGWA